MLMSFLKYVAKFSIANCVRGGEHKTAGRTVNARLKICLQFLFSEHDQRPLGCH